MNSILHLLYCLTLHRTLHLTIPCSQPEGRSKGEERNLRGSTCTSYSTLWSPLHSWLCPSSSPWNSSSSWCCRWASQLCLWSQERLSFSAWYPSSLPSWQYLRRLHIRDTLSVAWTTSPVTPHTLAEKLWKTSIPVEGQIPTTSCEHSFKKIFLERTLHTSQIFRAQW